ncbi:MAG TPA: hypothetical protein VLH94_02970 [Spirochaetia bacterium]|nr:hypothetical protein [Spirochaetia bacterium]
MKIAQVDSKWFLEDNNKVHTPLSQCINNAINAGLEKPQYVACTKGNYQFIIMSMYGAGFVDHFNVEIIKLQSEPYIVLYNIKDQSLAKKFANWLITFHPADKVSLYPSSFLTLSLIEEIIALYK